MFRPGSVIPSFKEEGSVTIEMSEDLFARIGEKTQEIKELATLARMGPDEELPMRISQILGCANELSRLENQARILI